VAEPTFLFEAIQKDGSYVELFGERGKPTRGAIGCQGSSRNHSVEVVMTALFSGAEVADRPWRETTTAADRAGSLT